MISSATPELNFPGGGNENGWAVYPEPFSPVRR